jgi:phenylacetic acid degradation protein
MALYEFNGKRPNVDPSAYVHPSAVLIGDVTVGACCYIGPLASLRGDFGAVVVERGSNVQDACVLHTGINSTCRLGVDSHVGHGAIVHGATLEPNTMVGMHAVVMDGVVLGEASIVAACAFVKKDWRVPPRVLVAGVPGRVLRLLTDEEIRAKSSGTRIYQKLAADCLRTMRSV